MSNTQLELNLKISKVQQKVDDLKNLLFYANRYNAQNKDMVANDLKRAECELIKIKGK